MKSIKILTIIITVFLFTACGQQSNIDKSTEEVENVHNESEEIALSDDQMKAVNITIGEIEKKELNNIVRANGKLALTPQNRANVNSLIGGIIRQILVNEGEYVAAGKTLAFLENTEIVELQKTYLTSKKETLIAEQELKRQNELNSQGAGVEKTLQQANASYEISKTQLIGLEKQLLQLSISPQQISTGNIVIRIPIKAPISGTVDKINVNIGSYVDIQNAIMNLSDNSKIHSDLSIFEKDLSSVAVGQEVAIRLTNQQGEYLRGIIYEINKSFENDTKAALAHVRIKNTEGLKLFAGMYVTAIVNVGKQSTDAVPNEAIISKEGKKYIFVFEEKMEKNGKKYTCFKRVEVIPGISELGYTQIFPVSKMEQDAKIVVSGAFYIASMSAEEEDHHH